MALAPLFATACHSGGVRPRSAELFALDARTGRQQWRVRLDNLDVTPPIAGGDAVYVGGSSGTAAYEGATGHLRWHSGYVSQSSPLGANVVGSSLVTSDGHSIVAVDKTGDELWRNQDADYGCPVTADVTGAYARASDGEVHALDLGNGHQRWTVAAEPGFCAPVLPAGGAVYVGDTDGTIRALDAGSGEQRWSVVTEVKMPVPQGMSNGSLFVKPLGANPVNGGTVLGLDVRDGHELFRVGPLHGVPPFDLAVGRAIYGYQGTFGSPDLAAFDARSGTLRWHESVPLGRLATGEGLVVSAGPDITAVADVDGAHRWTAPLDYSDARVVHAAIGGGRVYVVVGTGSRPNED